MMEGFTALNINLDGDGAFADLVDETWQGGTIEGVAALPEGTTGGKPSVALKVRCADGSYVVAETTWNLLYSAARAIEARYGPAA